MYIYNLDVFYHWLVSLTCKKNTNYRTPTSTSNIEVTTKYVFTCVFPFKVALIVKYIAYLRLHLLNKLQTSP